MFGFQYLIGIVDFSDSMDNMINRSDVQEYKGVRQHQAGCIARRLELEAQQVAAKGCENCVHKSICILYHGHGQLELRFGRTYVKDPDGFINKLDERLARRCRFYMEGQGGV